MSYSNCEYTPAPRIDEENEITRVERVFVNCNDCKKVTTVDFTFEMFRTYGARGMIISHVEYRYPDGHLDNILYTPPCPHCGSKKVYKKYLKKHSYSSKHTCGDTCKNATSETCTCSCDGTNHGVNNKKENGALTLF